MYFLMKVFGFQFSNSPHQVEHEGKVAWRIKELEGLGQPKDIRKNILGCKICQGPVWDGCIPRVTTRLVGQGPVLWCLREASRAHPGVEGRVQERARSLHKFSREAGLRSSCEHELARHGQGLVCLWQPVRHSTAGSRQVCSDQTDVRDTGVQVWTGSELGLNWV